MESAFWTRSCHPVSFMERHKAIEQSLPLLPLGIWNVSLFEGQSRAIAGTSDVDETGKDRCPWHANGHPSTTVLTSCLHSPASNGCRFFRHGIYLQWIMNKASACGFVREVPPISLHTPHHISCTIPLSPHFLRNHGARPAQGANVHIYCTYTTRDRSPFHLRPPRRGDEMNTE